MLKTLFLALVIFLGLVAFDSKPHKEEKAPAPAPKTEQAENQAERARQLLKGIFLAVAPPEEQWPEPVRNLYRAVNMQDTVEVLREQPDWTPLANMATDLPRALIAIEDHDFYNHGALAAEGLVRAFLANVLSGKVVQGGSTITQQLVKNLFLTSEQSMERKISEAIFSLIVESQYSKDEILEIYLNSVYFGAGSSGVKAASRAYFNKAPSALTLAECAVLAALPNAPSALNPLENPEGCRARQLLVLNAMNKYALINEQQLREARAEKIVLTNGTLLAEGAPL